MSDASPTGRHPVPVVIVAGPTASGKSHLALALAERHGGEIVNADSMQVYRELPILTARPGPADEARVPHHLYGILSVAEPGSAGIWLDRATAVIADIRRRRRVPIVCGGTGLYLKVLREGIAPVPKVPAEVVAEAGALYDRDGAATFHARLAAVDPTAADRLPPTDRQRAVRAYAVATATGRTLDQWQAEQPDSVPVDGPFLTILLAPERAALYRRIEARLTAMLDAGALDEVAALDGADLADDLPALKALGVPEFRRYLAGACDLEAALAKARQTTRNFAKRQATWFRHQMTADVRIGDFGDAALATADAALAAYLKQETC